MNIRAVLIVGLFLTWMPQTYGQKLDSASSQKNWETQVQNVSASLKTKTTSVKKSSRLGAQRKQAHCRLPIVTIENGKIYRFNQKGDKEYLGSDAVDYKAACTGDVAWVEQFGSFRTMHKNQTALGSGVAEYSIVLRTGDVVWIEQSGSSCKIHKNQTELGSDVVKYAAAAYTGDVVWIEQFGSFRKIYKNGVKLGDDPVDFILYPDGRVLWTDRQGRGHAGLAQNL